MPPLVPPMQGAPTSPRSSTATPSAWTPPGPTWWTAVTPAGTAPPARTSPTSSTRARFVEYGPLVIAAQRRRRPLDDLIARTPADGLVAGVGTVDGRPTAVLSYDYTVLAGTQGYRNHHKKDRLFDVIERQRLPVVFFAEGGGGRPGDTDAPGVSGLDTLAFHLWGRLSGLVPRVGIANGRCFAGNAAILGSSDVVIATRGSNIGMGGPAMIEGGGLGVFAPEDVGPVDVQVANGVVDVAGRRRGRGGGRRQAVPVLLRRSGRERSGPRMAGGRPGRAARPRAREPPAGLRRAGGDHRAGRHGLGARAARRLRARG